MQIEDRDPNAYYQSKLGVRFYDLFTGDAHDNGPVKGDVSFYIECAREEIQIEKNERITGEY